MKISAIGLILFTILIFGPVGASAQITFATRVNYETGSSYYTEPDWVDTGDLDGDGDIDIVVLNYGIRNAAIFFNNGNGIFDDPVYYTVPVHPRVVRTQDVNGDEKLDLLVTSQSVPYQVEILYNNGNGVFEETKSLLAESALWDVQADYIDADDLLDIVATNSATNEFSVFINVTDTGYAEPDVYGTNTGPHIIQAIDYDGDKDVDLAVSNFLSNNVSIAKNKGNGEFISGGNLPTGLGPNSLVAADFNGDLIPDLATANQIANTISVLIGNGNGTFQSATTYSAFGGDPYHIIAGDVDLDDDLDLIFIDHYSNVLVIMPNNGDGTFASGRLLSTGDSPEGLAAGDFDGDGDLDLVVANRFDNTISIFFNLINTPSGVDDNDNTLPRDFVLNQNYPNPFNPETRIDFSLERRAHVDISIYNILGQEINNLLNTTLAAGPHSVYWNGTDQSGREMPSGIYFYRLKTETQTEIRKMMLLK